MPEWEQVAISQELVLPKFRFDCGETAMVRLRCRTLGQLNRSKDNGVLALHGTTGSSLQFLKPSMADHLFKEGQPLDQSQFFTIIPDAIGHGGSSKPSEAGKDAFPQYSYDDVVRGQHEVVQQLFGIQKLRLVIGTSMGGMNTWMWGIRYPEMVQALMPIACLPRSISGLNLLFRRLILAIIETDSALARQQVPQGSVGVGLAWNLFHLLTLSPAKLQQQITTPAAADQRIAEISKTASGIPAADAVWEFRASVDYNPLPDLHRIVAPLLSLNFVDDQINSPGFANLVHDIQKVRQGRSMIIDAGEQSYGHQTHSHAVVWSRYLSDFLRNAK